MNTNLHPFSGRGKVVALPIERSLARDYHRKRRPRREHFAGYYPRLPFGASAVELIENDRVRFRVSAPARASRPVVTVIRAKGAQ